MAGFDISNNIISGKVDDVTMTFSDIGDFIVKDGGIGATQLEDASISTTKLASPTGTHTNVVTGTAGDTGNLVAWDANDDAVDSGFDVTDDDGLGTSDTTLPTQGNVKAYVDSITIGVGQEWEDVLSSRVANTSYQNTTGKPIMVAISGRNDSNPEVQVSTDEVAWVEIGQFNDNVSGAVVSEISFIVPDEHYYRVTGTGATVWTELR